MEHPTVCRWARWARRALFGFAVAFSFVELFFVIDAMHACGTRAFGLMGAGLLLTSAMRLWVVVEVVWRLGRLIGGGKAGLLPLGRTLAIALLIWSPPVVLGMFPLLPHHSFLWLHEDAFLRCIRSQERRENVDHYEHGSAFRFSWYTITDCCYVVIYEPDRLPGSRPLGRDTERFYAGMLDLDVHVRGPWYAVVY
jgi:hypothetical protein